MDESDHYAILGISPDADADAIKSAHRNLVGQLHPDRQMHLSDAERKASGEKLAAVNVARDRLLDPALREKSESWVTRTQARPAPAIEKIYEAARLLEQAVAKRLSEATSSETILVECPVEADGRMHRMIITADSACAGAIFENFQEPEVSGYEDICCELRQDNSDSPRAMLTFSLRRNVGNICHIVDALDVLVLKPLEVIDGIYIPKIIADNVPGRQPAI